ncbi:hypothetical protein HD597_007261 [Nonomuraea thailandensis]|uniref:Uncharacterized protein n=1 Tax=Nonomuraea thailandensis TaxID=1188745 RepID=A0A9X2GR88_9ACTN|nr:hypothetical protein [Nonomuraea thailandensis]MCP2360241.1 hypothetical protein [Nonomuraea thailandensis]
MSITDVRTATHQQIADLQPNQETRDLLADDRIRQVMREAVAGLDRYTAQYRQKYRELQERAAHAQFQAAPEQQRAHDPARAAEYSRGPEYSRAAEQIRAPEQQRAAQQLPTAEQLRAPEQQQPRMAEQARPLQRGDLQAATPMTPTNPPYLWFDLMALGPYREPYFGGPLQPARVVHYGENVYLFAVLWRNPMSLLGGPSAAEVMAPFVYQVRGVSVELNSVTPGPTLSPSPAAFGPDYINIIPMRIPTDPRPAEGRPRPLEIHLTVDILGVGVGLPPFAGFASRWYRPDLQPGFLGFPDLLPGIVEETPVRMLIYS